MEALDDVSSPLLSLFDYTDVALGILRNFDTRSYRVLALSCKTMNAWLKSNGEALFRSLCLHRVRHHSLVRPLGSFAEMFLRVPSTCVLGLLDSSQAEIGWLLEGEDGKERVSCLAVPDVSLTSSPNGQMVCWTHAGTLRVMRLCRQTNVKTLFQVSLESSNTIYMYFDASSSILTWLSFAGRSLELNWVDLTTKSIHKAPFSGSPLFWHLSPTDPQLLLAHTRGRVMLLHLFGESVGKVTQVFFADVSNSCQVVHLVDGNRSFIISYGRHLLLLDIRERNAIESAQILEDLDPSHVLHEFQTEGMCLFQTTEDDCVVAGLIDEIFFREIWDINIRTKARTRILEMGGALCFFLSPSANNRRFVLCLAFDAQDFVWIVHDRISRVEKMVTARVARSTMLVNNRRPFQAAYSLSHSPWHNREPNRFIFRDSDNRMVSVRVVVAEKTFDLVEEVIKDDSMSASMVCGSIQRPIFLKSKGGAGSMLRTKAKLYDFVSSVTNWKPKGVGICNLSLDEGVLSGYDERGDFVLQLTLSSSMVYSRAASTFHTIETAPKVGIALYFGSSSSDEWFSPDSVDFAAALEKELSSLGAAEAVRPPPNVPSRPSPRPSASSSAPSMPAPVVPSAKTPFKQPRAPAPVVHKVKSPEPSRAHIAVPEPTKKMEPEIAIAETVEVGKVETAVVAKVEEPSDPPLDLSVDVDWTMVDKLPSLPDVAPLSSQQREYKNYQKLRMEILRRDPDANIPLSSPPASASPPAMMRRNTNPRPVKMIAKKSEESVPAPIPMEKDDSVEQKSAQARLRALVAPVLEYPDGSRYMGEIVAGKKHGKGFLVYCDGSSFEGDFVHGKRSGFGTRTNPKSKDVFRGCYSNDQKHGFGWFFGEDGSESYYFYCCNELHGVGSFRWPRGTVEDREYNNGALVTTRKVSDLTWPPAYSSNYEKTSGLTQHIEFSGSASLVCILGSWDGFAKVIPLGFDFSTGIHSLRLILAKGSHYFRFVVVNGAEIAECTSNHCVWPVEDDESGIASHVIEVK